jgi:hypothetical protein
VGLEGWFPALGKELMTKVVVDSGLLTGAEDDDLS